MVQLELQPQPCQRDARCHCHRTPTCRWLGTRDECPCECCSAERGRLRALHVRRGGGYISGRGETGYGSRLPVAAVGAARHRSPATNACAPIRARESTAERDRIRPGPQEGGVAARRPVGGEQGRGGGNGIFCNPTTDTACAVRAVLGLALLLLAAPRVPEALYYTPYSTSYASTTLA